MFSMNSVHRRERNLEEVSWNILSDVSQIFDELSLLHLLRFNVRIKHAHSFFTNNNLTEFLFLFEHNLSYFWQVYNYI